MELLCGKHFAVQQQVGTSLVLSGLPSPSTMSEVQEYRLGSLVYWGVGDGCFDPSYRWAIQGDHESARTSTAHACHHVLQQNRNTNLR